MYFVYDQISYLFISSFYLFISLSINILSFFPISLSFLLNLSISLFPKWSILLTLSLYEYKFIFDYPTKNLVKSLIYLNRIEWFNALYIKYTINLLSIHLIWYRINLMYRVAKTKTFFYWTKYVVHRNYSYILLKTSIYYLFINLSIIYKSI